MASCRWARVRNVLCIRLDTLGDVVMMEPAIRALREGAAGRRITLLTSASGAEAVPLMPAVDDVMVYESPWMKATQPQQQATADRTVIRRLKQRRFEAAVIFTCFSQSPLPAAMLCYLADIPLRLAHCRENPYQLLTDWIKETEPEQGIRHEVRRQLDLVSQVAAPLQDTRIRLQTTELDRRTARRVLHRAGVDLARPWVVVHPGASAASRRWPLQHFAAAAALLAADLGYQVVFTGIEADRPLIAAIRSQVGHRTHSLAGRLRMPHFAGLLSLAPLLIANNTGPVHVAAGVGTPVVDVYALTNPQHTPWGVPARVLSAEVPCKYCFRSICPEQHHRCLRDVLPHQVVAAAVDLLRETALPPTAAGVAC